jgi:hypothetical protein
MAPLSAASRETVFATGCIGVLVGSATGVLFPTFWRFVSDAILTQDAPTGKRKNRPMPVLRLTVVTIELMVEPVKQSGMTASLKGEAEMEAKQGNAIRTKGNKQRLQQEQSLSPQRRTQC